MRQLLITTAVVLACGAAHAQDLTKLAQATTTEAAPAPQASPAAQAAPTAQAAPETAAPPAAQSSKPAQKKQVRRRETDEEKARRIAAKYDISW